MFCHYFFLNRSFADTFVALVWARRVRTGRVWRAGEKAAAALWSSGGETGEDDLFFPHDIAPRFALPGIFLTGTECLRGQNVTTDAQCVCFSFLSRIGRTDGCYGCGRFPGTTGGEGICGLTLKRDYCSGKERERDKQTTTTKKTRVRRRGKGEYRADHELTKWPPSLLDAHRPERLCGFNQPDEEQNGARSSRRILSGTFLTDSRRSPITLPPTSSPSHVHIHPRTQTHCLTGQCELFGFRCGPHHFSPHAQICSLESLRCYLKFFVNIN